MSALRVFYLATAMGPLPYSIWKAWSIIWPIDWLQAIIVTCWMLLAWSELLRRALYGEDTHP